MPSTTLSSLPPETWDQIIDCLHSEKRALSACGLVHRAWTESARYHLFRQTTINFGSDDLEDISQVFPISGGGVVPHVRELRLLDDPKSSSPVDALPATMLPQFPSIKSMSLRFQFYRDAPKTTISWVMSQIKTVEAMKISIETSSIDQILALISAASSLKSLRLYRATFNELEDLSPEELETKLGSYVPPPITHLALCFDDCRRVRPLWSRSLSVRLIRWISLHWHGSHGALRTFHVEDLDVDGTPALKICLDTIGIHIEHLRLRSHDLLYMPTVDIALGRMINLKSISIMSSIDEPLHNIGTILSRIPSKHLTDVIVELWIDEALDIIYGMDPSEVAEVYNMDTADKYFADINPRNPAQSASLRFVCCNRSSSFNDTDYIQGFLQDVFPRTGSQGRLKVEFDDGKAEDYDMSLDIYIDPPS